VPEGDSLHRIALRLGPLLEGKVVRSLELPRRAQRATAIEGTKLTKVEARGKNLLVFFESGHVLHTHLRMNGRWRVLDPAARPKRWSGDVVVALEVDGCIAVCERAPVVRFVREKSLAHDPMIGGLGPDPIRPDFAPASALSRLRALADVPLGEAIVDQRAVAGIGNIWKSELLFELGLDPFAPVRAFTDEELTSLLGRAEKRMRRGVRTGFGTMRVYDRAKQRCRTCGGVVERRMQGLRSTYVCPTCQPARRT
jgi:endonuclease-8